MMFRFRQLSFASQLKAGLMVSLLAATMMFPPLFVAYASGSKPSQEVSRDRPEKAAG